MSAQINKGQTTTSATVPGVMSFGLQHMFEKKRALRRHLAVRPVAEKLSMLDAMRERALAIRAASPVAPNHSVLVREEPPEKREGGGKAEP